MNNKKTVQNKIYSYYHRNVTKAQYKKYSRLIRSGVIPRPFEDIDWHVGFLVREVRQHDRETVVRVPRKSRYKTELEAMFAAVGL